MKTIIRPSIKNVWFILVLAFVLDFGCKCTVSGPGPDPLAGWMFREFDAFSTPSEQHHYALNKTVTDDYQDFIVKEQLSPKGAITGFFEDGTGQHAIEFEANGNKENSSWRYVLIYDNENKRIKVIKYDYRRYQS